MLLNDQLGSTARRQAVEPAFEQRMQVLLTDTNWWVRHDQVESLIARDGIGFVHGDVKAEPLGVGRTQLSGSCVDVDSPHRCRRRTVSNSAGDGAISAADVEDCLGVARLSRLKQEHPRSRVDLV